VFVRPRQAISGGLDLSLREMVDNEKVAYSIACFTQFAVGSDDFSMTGHT
jgi:hypothetical protein